MVAVVVVAGVVGVVVVVVGQVGVVTDVYQYRGSQQFINLKPICVKYFELMLHNYKKAFFLFFTIQKYYLCNLLLN